MIGDVAPLRGDARVSLPAPMSDLSVPADCRRCGACCCSGSPEYVRVTGDDWARLGPAAESLAHFIGQRAFLRMRDGHCAALALRRGDDGTTDFFCTIYDRRPQICRDLERGSPQCQAEVVRKSAFTVSMGDANLSAENGCERGQSEAD